MADRLYSAQIKYPFWTGTLADIMTGVLDCLFYMSPEDTFVTPSWTPSGLGQVGAWIQDRVKVGSDWQYTCFAAAPADPDRYPLDEPYEAAGTVYVQRTFLVPDAPVGTIAVARATEDSRSALITNNGQIAGATTLLTAAADVQLNPAVVVPCTRKITQVNIYNEFRASDPANRNELPPDYLQETLFPGDTIKFNDGYNCAVSYNESTGTLRLTGGLGFGLGRPEYTPWDDTDEDLDEGVRDINGVNALGDVPIEVGAGLTLDTSVPGQLRILVRNQGDLSCPPE